MYSAVSQLSGSKTKGKKENKQHLRAWIRELNTWSKFSKTFYLELEIFSPWFMDEKGLGLG